MKIRCIEKTLFKPVELEANCTVILPLIVSFLCLDNVFFCGDVAVLCFIYFYYSSNREFKTIFEYLELINCLEFGIPKINIGW